jgi:hypothetical protein
MHLRKGVAAFAALIAAAAVAVPVASASTQTTTATPTVVMPIPPSLGLPGVGCPIWYGTPNPATGCTPFWVVHYVSFLQLFQTLGFPLVLGAA